MTSWIPDFRAALRSLRRAPGYTASAVSTIALGIASVTLVYALVSAILLQPLPLPDPGRVVAVYRAGTQEGGLSLPDVIYLRERLSQFAAIATVAPDSSFDRTDGERPERLRGALVESTYFAVVGLPPRLGRLLRAQDDLPGAAPVVVLSESYWRSAFAADPGVIGRRLQLSGVSAEIVGVADARSDLAELGAQLWASIPPWAPWAPSSPGSNNFEVVARVAGGAEVGAAAAELRQVSSALAQERDNPGKVLELVRWSEVLTGAVARGLWLLLAAVGLLLALATANVGALMLVRSSRRSAELSLRSALGASRAQVLRLQLVEGLVIGGLGGGIGIAVALAAFAALREFAQGVLPRLAGATLSPEVLLVAALATLGSALIASILPAWRTRPAGAGLRLADAGRSRSESRVLASLATLEVALAGSLLGAAALLTLSFLRLADLPLGFQAGGVIAGEVVLPQSRYQDLAPQTQAFERMVAELAQKPGVEDAAMVVGPPLLAGQGIGHTLLVEGQALVDASARYRPFVGDYFSAIGIPLLAGRGVEPGDGRGERVAWVNQAFVARYLQGRDPLGARVAWQPGEASREPNPQWMRVAGVVADVRGGNWRGEESPAVYAPYRQREADWIRFGTLVARVAGDPSGYRDALASAVSAADPALPIGEVASMTERSERALGRDRLLMQLVGAFAALALTLGIQGVFGVVAFGVQQKRADLAVRLALGATRGRALRGLLAATLPQLLTGAAIGLALTYAAGYWLREVLYGVSAGDPLLLAMVAGLLVASGLLAAWIPAHRGLRVDPAASLRG